ncbi:acyl carrier protein [Levilactobacillus brevis]|uniref:acyl carrier protein n=1 Tax=Levilactobacillus brevis TaxID=1580 RepID=UPI001122E905|nr:acyl carrier protein [Levilactobacillus brevis]TOY84601.1 acyl carrier protein [Levilactobacillus brevis]
MTKAEIFDKIADIIADRFEVDRDTINDQLNFKQDLDADSIDFVEFVLELEDTFSAEISDEDAEKLNTIGEVVDYINAHQPGDK